MPGSSPAGMDGSRAKGPVPHRRSDQARVAVLHAAGDLPATDWAADPGGEIR